MMQSLQDPRYEANWEVIRAQHQVHYEANKERIRAQEQARKEEIRARKRTYRKTHREEIRARERTYYKTHREEIRARREANKKKREANKKEISAQILLDLARSPSIEYKTSITMDELETLLFTNTDWIGSTPPSVVKEWADICR
jgi:hypothetical protein